MAPVQFGNYQILRKIGTGGMAQVFEAQRLGLEGFSRRVALKCILPEMTRDHRFVEMFINEARLGSQLHHPNIVEIQDFNKVNDVYYIAMEFVEGVDLGEVIRRFRDEEREFPPGLAIDVMLQALEGLGYAHEATTDDGDSMCIIHRDIKPSNLLLTRRGTVKIADFGIAKAATNAYQTRTSEVTKGSLAYMAPEQITREAPVSPSSDLFSLGAVLFEVLSLRALFDGENMPSIMFKVAQVEIHRDLTELEVHFPQFIPILRKALARDVHDRYPSASAMAADLRPLRAEFAPGPSIQEVVAEFVKAHHHEEGEQVGEHTLQLLGVGGVGYDPIMSGAYGGSNILGPQGGQGQPMPYPPGTPPPPGPYAGQQGPYATPNLASYAPQGAVSNPNFAAPPPTPYSSNPLARDPGAYPSYPVPLAPTGEGFEDSQPSLNPGQTTRPVRKPMTSIAIFVAVLVVGLVAAWAAGLFQTSPATLMVSSSPGGAQILINGRVQTHMSNGALAPQLTPSRVVLPATGPVDVTLQLEGFEAFSQTLNYAAGDSMAIAPTLKPLSLTGSLEVSSDPPGAQIELNGQVLPKVTPYRIDNLPAGQRYIIRLRLQGYVGAEGNTEVRKGGVTVYTAALVPEKSAATVPASTPAVVSTPRPQPTPRPPEEVVKAGPTPAPTPKAAPAGKGTLVVSAVPPDCVVFVDGARKGNAPVSVSLPAGRHKVRLERFDGTTAKSFSVEVAPGQEVTRVWDLEAQTFIAE